MSYMHPNTGGGGYNDESEGVVISPAQYSGASAIGALINSGAQIYSNYQTNKTNKKIAREANEAQYRLWQEQMAYNTPSAQMQRLIDAGLNPNSIYGSGNVTGNMAGSPPSVQRAEMKPVMDGVNLLPSFMSVLTMYTDFKLKQQQIDNAKAAEDNIRADIDFKKLKGLTMWGDIEKSGWTQRHVDEIMQTQLDSMKLSNSLKKTQIQTGKYSLDNVMPENLGILQIQRKLQQSQLDMNQNLQDYNLSSGDSWYAKVMAMLLQKMGLNFGRK